jgi:hypothetical protein
MKKIIALALVLGLSSLFASEAPAAPAAPAAAAEKPAADAKAENEQPQNARVLPEDADDVHIAIHNAEIERRNRELEMAQQQGMEVPPEVIEELQMLTQHRDDHVTKAGGVNPGSTPGELPPNQQL